MKKAPHDRPIASAVQPVAMQYRSDIDGLRALAILPVVVFHLGVPFVSGGFVGVDIFFVISGFLIASLVLHDQADGTFSLARFYERRARRILPALYIVLVAATVCAGLILVPTDLRDFGKSLTSVVLFVSNFYFRSTSGYFNVDASIRPLLHTWSLAVEEQFYMAFPLLMVLVRRWPRDRQARSITAIAVLSFGASVYLSTRSPAFAFYSPFTRAWELLLGAVLSLNFAPWPRSRSASDLVGAGGICLIAISLLLINRHVPFPGWAALAPCLGAAAVIQTGKTMPTKVSSFLSAGPLVLTGKLSYSLYLWHWPVIVFARYRLNRSLSLPEAAISLAVIFTLSLVSWHYVERPVRTKRLMRNRRAVFVAAALTMLGLVAIGTVLISTGGLPGRLNAEAAPFAQYDFGETDPKCFNNSAEQVSRGELCIIGATNATAPAFVLWGDSHASRVEIPIADQAQKAGRRGFVASKGFCAPVLSSIIVNSDCASYNAAVWKLIRTRGVSTVILSAMWASYAEGTRFGTGEWTALDREPATDRDREIVVQKHRKQFRDEFGATIRALHSLGVAIVVVDSIPEMPWDVPRTFTLAAWAGRPLPHGPTLLEFESRQNAVREAFQPYVDQQAIRFIHPQDILCATTCAPRDGSKPLYGDDNHLTRRGLEVIRPLFDGIFMRGIIKQSEE